MKATGIVRKVDSLNRIVIPIEICRTHGIEEGTPIEIYTEGDTVILKKYAPGCSICGEVGEFKEFGGLKFCKKHWNGLKEAVRNS